LRALKHLLGHAPLLKDGHGSLQLVAAAIVVVVRLYDPRHPFIAISHGGGLTGTKRPSSLFFQHDVSGGISPTDWFVPTIEQNLTAIGARPHAVWQTPPDEKFFGPEPRTVARVINFRFNHFAPTWSACHPPELGEVEHMNQSTQTEQDFAARIKQYIEIVGRSLRSNLPTIQDHSLRTTKAGLEGSEKENAPMCREEHRGSS
jgi:hypothetical protein